MRTRIFLALWVAVIFTSCVKDRQFPPLETIYVQPGKPNLTGKSLIHYWNFNGTSLLTPTTTKGGATLSYVGGSATADAVNPGTDLNARGGDVAGSALRLRNPAGVFTMSLPTTNYKDILLSFDLQRTDNGAQINKISYSLDGTNFITTDLKPSMHQVAIAWQTFTYNFSQITGANNNANFKVRIEFEINEAGDSGNNRFDNIALDGNEIDPNFGTPEIVHYWNFNGTSLLSPTITKGGASLDYPNNASNSGLPYYDSADGTDVNARNADVAGNSLRLRNPAGSFTFTITAPTTGYKSIRLSFAVLRTSAGAQQNIVTYTLNGTDYISTGITTNTYSPALEPAPYALINYDFSAITGINNNPNFKIKIGFANGNTNPTGNNRFDNLVIEGIKL